MCATYYNVCVMKVPCVIIIFRFVIMILAQFKNNRNVLRVRFPVGTTLRSFSKASKLILLQCLLIHTKPHTFIRRVGINKQPLTRALCYISCYSVQVSRNTYPFTQDIF